MLSVRIAFPMLKVSMKIILCNHSLKFPFRPVVISVACELRGIRVFFLWKNAFNLFFCMLAKRNNWAPNVCVTRRPYCRCSTCPTNVRMQKSEFGSSVPVKPLHTYKKSRKWDCLWRFLESGALLDWFHSQGFFSDGGWRRTSEPSKETTPSCCSWIIIEWLSHKLNSIPFSDTPATENQHVSSFRKVECVWNVGSYSISPRCPLQNSESLAETLPNSWRTQPSAVGRTSGGGNDLSHRHHIDPWAWNNSR